MWSPAIVVFFIPEVISFSLMYIVDNNYVIIQLHGSFKCSSFFYSEICVELPNKTLASYFTADSSFAFQTLSSL